MSRLRALLKPPDVEAMGEPDPEARVKWGGCGLAGGVFLLGCFPLLLLGAMALAWWGPLALLTTSHDDRAVRLLDEIAIAEETWRGAHGEYFAGPPWPREAGMDVQEVCRIEVTVPEPLRYDALVECPAEEPIARWKATEVLAPHRQE